LLINVYKLTLKISGQSFTLVISLALVQLGQRVAKRQGTESGQRNSGSQHNYSIFMNIKNNNECITELWERGIYSSSNTLN
jgi:hypothetical protein